jgi:integrase
MTALQSKRHSTTIRIPVGPGTGIDTKGDKQMSLHIPVWFYQMLLTYVDSDRAHHRRTLAKGGDTENQYLFLSRYGTPFYKSKADSLIFDNNSKLRQPIKGQSVRKFIEEAIIPYIQRKYDVTFRYQFHDLRASFGMNLTDSQLILVTQGKRTLSQVREFVKTRMGHTSAATTDRYLQFRGNLTHVLQVLDDHDEHLRNLVEKAGLI